MEDKGDRHHQKGREVKKPAQISRRAFLLGVGGLALAGAAVVVDKNIRIITGEKVGSDNPEIAKYYSELMVAHIKEAGSFKTSRTETHWINFSSHKFNKAFHVEACQSTLYIDAPPQEQNVIQEIVANSVGQAGALRQQGVSYDEYTKWVTGAHQVIDGADSYLIKLDESVYNAIPTVGSVIQ